MKNGPSALQVISCLAGISVLGLGLFTLGLPFGRESFTAFAIGASALLLAGAIRDYAPRRARWEPARHAVVARFPARRHVIRRRVSALTAA